MKVIGKLWCNITEKLEKFGAPIWDLIARVYLFYVFMTSGWVAFQSFMDGHWDKVVYRFDKEFGMPWPEVISVLSTVSEILFSILLLVGIFSRFSALVLLVITVMIEFSYQQHNTMHYLWMFLAASIFFKGPGALSVDHKLCCKGGKSKK